MLASQYRTKDHTKLRLVRSADRRRGLDRGLPRWSPGRGCTFSISDTPDRGCTISSGARFDHARSMHGLYWCQSRHFCIKTSSIALLPARSVVGEILELQNPRCVKPHLSIHYIAWFFKDPDDGLVLTDHNSIAAGV